MESIRKKITAISLVFAVSTGTLAYNLHNSKLREVEHQNIIVKLDKENKELLTALSQEKKQSYSRSMSITELNKRMKQLTDISNNESAISRFDLTIEATAYNMDEELKDKWNGMTATGINLLNKDASFRVVAVDPNVIPLKKYIYVVFQDKDYKKYNGWWYTGDTGSAVKGNVVDFYLGEETPDRIKVTDNFGRRTATIVAITDAK